MCPYCSSLQSYVQVIKYNRFETFDYRFVQHVNFVYLLLSLCTCNILSNFNVNFFEEKVIIYGRGGGGANLRIVCTQNVPPLGMRELRFRPPRILRTEILPPPHHQNIDMYCKLSYHSLHKYIM